MSRRGARAIGVMSGSAVLMVLAGLVYLGGGLGTLHFARAAATPTAAASPWNGTCPPTELKVTGAYMECAAMDHGMFCPSSFDQVKSIRLHGTKHDFIIYVEIYGGYHGPGTYQLRPWPHPSLGVKDGAAKVALREWVSGALFESVSGSLVVDDLENSGFVYAGLGVEPVLEPGTLAKVDVNLSGWWSCS